MELGAEINTKVKKTIKKQLQTLGCYVDDELPEYIMVMIANKRTKEQMIEDLNLFLSDEAEKFVTWLLFLLQRIQKAVEVPDIDWLMEDEVKEKEDVIRTKKKTIDSDTDTKKKRKSSLDRTKRKFKEKGKSESETDKEYEERKKRREKEAEEREENRKKEREKEIKKRREERRLRDEAEKQKKEERKKARSQSRTKNRSRSRSVSRKRARRRSRGRSRTRSRSNKKRSRTRSRDRRSYTRSRSKERSRRSNSKEKRSSSFNRGKDIMEKKENSLVLENEIVVNGRIERNERNERDDSLRELAEIEAKRSEQKGETDTKNPMEFVKQIALDINKKLLSKAESKNTSNAKKALTQEKDFAIPLLDTPIDDKMEVTNKANISLQAVSQYGEIEGDNEKGDTNKSDTSKKELRSRSRSRSRSKRSRSGSLGRRRNRRRTRSRSNNRNYSGRSRGRSRDRKHRYRSRSRSKDRHQNRQSKKKSKSPNRRSKSKEQLSGRNDRSGSQEKKQSMNKKTDSSEKSNDLKDAKSSSNNSSNRKSRDKFNSDKQYNGEYKKASKDDLRDIIATSNEDDAHKKKSVQSKVKLNTNFKRPTLSKDRQPSSALLKRAVTDVVNEQPARKEQFMEYEEVELDYSENIEDALHVSDSNRNPDNKRIISFNDGNSALPTITLVSYSSDHKGSPGRGEQERTPYDEREGRKKGSRSYRELSYSDEEIELRKGLLNDMSKVDARYAILKSRLSSKISKEKDGKERVKDISNSRPKYMGSMIADLVEDDNRQTRKKINEQNKRERKRFYDRLKRKDETKEDTEIKERHSDSSDEEFSPQKRAQELKKETERVKKQEQLRNEQSVMNDSRDLRNLLRNKKDDNRLDSSDDEDTLANKLREKIKEEKHKRLFGKLKQEEKAKLKKERDELREKLKRKRYLKKKAEYMLRKAQARKKERHRKHIGNSKTDEKRDQNEEVEEKEESSGSDKDEWVESKNIENREINNTIVTEKDDGENEYEYEDKETPNDNNNDKDDDSSNQEEKIDADGDKEDEEEGNIIIEPERDISENEEIAEEVDMIIEPENKEEETKDSNNDNEEKEPEEEEQMDSEGKPENEETAEENDKVIVLDNNENISENEEYDREKRDTPCEFIVTLDGVDREDEIPSNVNKTHKRRSRTKSSSLTQSDEEFEEIIRTKDAEKEKERQSRKNRQHRSSRHSRHHHHHSSSKEKVNNDKLNDVDKEIILAENKLKTQQLLRKSLEQVQNVNVSLELHKPLKSNTAFINPHFQPNSSLFSNKSIDLNNISSSNDSSLSYPTSLVEVGVTQTDNVVNEIAEKDVSFTNSTSSDLKTTAVVTINQTISSPIETSAVNVSLSTTRSIQERCIYWPDCKKISCLYVHPTVPCISFPNCPYGSRCIYIHPTCKYGDRCTNGDCTFFHNRSQNSIPSFASSAICKFSSNCSKKDCTFTHPVLKPCRFGASCTNPDCLFTHENRLLPATKTDFKKHKWIAGKPHISERRFAVHDAIVSESPVAITVTSHN